MNHRSKSELLMDALAVQDRVYITHKRLGSVGGVMDCVRFALERNFEKSEIAGVDDEHNPKNYFISVNGQLVAYTEYIYTKGKGAELKMNFHVTCLPTTAAHLLNVISTYVEAEVTVADVFYPSLKKDKYSILFNEPAIVEYSRKTADEIYKKRKKEIKMLEQISPTEKTPIN